MRAIVVALAGGENAHPRECIVPTACPQGCLCADGIVDCRNAGLTDIPQNIPDSVTEL